MKINFKKEFEKDFVKMNIISSSSKGNCYIINKKIMIDIGVPFKSIEDYANDISAVLISHRHSDHVNKKTLLKLLKTNLKTKVFVNDDVFKFLFSEKEFKLFEEFKDRFVVMNIGKKYSFEFNNVLYFFTPIKLYHDVLNYGFLFRYQNKITNQHLYHLHGTDTHTADGISGMYKSIDILTFECNYTEKKALKNHEENIKNKKFSNYENVKNTHFGSENFIKLINNICKEDCLIRPCHISSSNFDVEEFKEKIIKNKEK